MPKRFIAHSRTEPARMVLWVTALVTLLAQTGAMLLDWPVGIANFVMVAPIAAWGVWAATKNKVRQMSTSSFWLFCLWFWTGLTRLFFVPGFGELLWVPFLTVAAGMGVVYINLSHQRRTLRIGDLD